MEDKITIIAESINKKLDYLIDLFEADKLAIEKEAAMELKWREIEKKIQPQPRKFEF